MRDRQSYEFAAASAAVGLELEADGKTIRDLRVALGGVATKPWRARAVEEALRGKVLEPEAVKRASLLAVEGAVDHGANRYKIDLAPRVVARAILKMGEIGMTVHRSQSKARRCLGRRRRGNASARGCRASTGRRRSPVLPSMPSSIGPARLVHAVIVQSTIAAGRVRAIDTAAAEASPGVLLVLTPDNALPLQHGVELAGHAAARCPLSARWRGHHLQRPACRGGRGRDLRAGDGGRRSGQGQL